MWSRFSGALQCPCCTGDLELIPIEEHKVELKRADYEKGEVFGIQPEKLSEYVDSGILLCASCKCWFPILYGLPVLLPYKTHMTDEFIEKYKSYLDKFASGAEIPKETPKVGEEFVLRSFSNEWLDYNYDGVIWGSSYDDREKTLLAEIGVPFDEFSGTKFLEIGCGLGLTTQFAQKNYEVDAVGVDLSLAVIKATDFFKDNPFLHFTQASLFQLPLKKNYFDLLYSHGVLHHTCSTKEALESIVPFCKIGGRTYIWVYGSGSQTDSWDRKLGHHAEAFLRPFLSQASTPVVTMVLTPIALGYIVFNTISRIKNPAYQRYTFNRALHAARDRFTPSFAFRQNYHEVEAWFKEFGFAEIQELDWNMVPPAAQDLYRRNTGVRGLRIK